MVTCTNERPPSSDILPGILGPRTVDWESRGRGETQARVGVVEVEMEQQALIILLSAWSSHSVNRRDGKGSRAHSSLNSAAEGQLHRAFSPTSVTCGQPFRQTASAGELGSRAGSPAPSIRHLLFLNCASWPLEEQLFENWCLSLISPPPLWVVFS